MDNIRERGESSIYIESCITKESIVASTSLDIHVQLDSRRSTSEQRHLGRVNCAGILVLELTRQVEYYFNNNISKLLHNNPATWAKVIAKARPLAKYLSLTNYLIKDPNWALMHPGTNPNTTHAIVNIYYWSLY